MKCDIVAVDDEPLVRSLLQSVFEIECWSARIFGRGAEALEFLNHNHAKVLVTDINMPSMNGIELATKVRDRHPHMGILAFTGSVEELSLDPTEFDIVIGKPCNLERFSEALRGLIKKAELQLDAKP